LKAESAILALEVGQKTLKESPLSEMPLFRNKKTPRSALVTSLFRSQLHVAASSLIFRKIFQNVFDAPR
jgi:hypothetical protein